MWCICNFYVEKCCRKVILLETLSVYLYILLQLSNYNPYKIMLLYIFFYQKDGLISGTFALIKISEDVFELGKMAVSKTMRGKGIGQKMLQFCLNFAQQEGWEKLILYSNTSLENSIYIYRKYGFTEVPIDVDNPYARGNIKMEKFLEKSK